MCTIWGPNADPNADPNAPNKGPNTGSNTDKGGCGNNGGKCFFEGKDGNCEKTPAGGFSCNTGQTTGGPPKCPATTPFKCEDSTCQRAKADCAKPTTGTAQTAAEFCAAYQTTCANIGTNFVNTAACETWYNAADAGTLADPISNTAPGATRACYQYHLSAARGAAATHCPHAKGTAVCVAPADTGNTDKGGCGNNGGKCFFEGKDGNCEKTPAGGFSCNTGQTTGCPATTPFKCEDSTCQRAKADCPRKETVCKKGQFKTAERSCMDCPAGQFTSNDAAAQGSQCTECEVGKYQEQRGQSFCTPCTGGVKTAKRGADSRKECRAENKDGCTAAFVQKEVKMSHVLHHLLLVSSPPSPRVIVCTFV